MVKGSKKNDSLQLEKLLSLQDLTVKRSARWLTTHLSYAIVHLPDKEELIFQVFKQCVIMLLLIKRSQKFRNKIFCMLECPQKSSWTIFLGKLTSSKDQSMLNILLLRILVQELISREKEFQPFWTPAYKEISEKLLLPTKTDSVDSDLNLSKCWLQRQEVRSRFLKIHTTEHVNKNSPTTFFPSSMSFHVDKWANEAMPIADLKTVKIKLYPTKNQKKILDEFIDTSRYVYNKTVEYIKNGHKPRHGELRDLLVTKETRKGHEDYKEYDEQILKLKAKKLEFLDSDQIHQIDVEIRQIQQHRRDHMKQFPYQRNHLVKDFELFTAKDIRDNAVRRCCDAHKTGFSNLKAGNIKYFNMKFQKKSSPRQMIELTPKNISIVQGKVKILPETFKDDCYITLSKTNARKFKNLVIQRNVDIVREKHHYYLHVCVETEFTEPKEINTIAGVDMGIRTFATIHSNSLKECKTTITEYKHDSTLLERLNKKLDILKQCRLHIRKKQFDKVEKRKCDVVDKLHWDFINDILKKNDVIYFGDIKSHDIVKGGKNKILNRNMNDLKFHVLKQRLSYKASLCGKLVFLTPEPYTTKTCSSCGTINNFVGCNEVFDCSKCGLRTGRDVNASKNIKMKGLFG